MTQILKVNIGFKSVIITIASLRSLMFINCTVIALSSHDTHTLYLWPAPPTYISS